MRMIDDYAGVTKGLPSHAHAGYLLRTSPDWDYLGWLRDAWDGPFIVKGVMEPSFVPRLEAAGVDALWISNHGGRQFDAARPTIEALPEIRAETKLPLLIDGGATCGLDILRALHLGANFVMMARPWHYALAALGPRGLDHFVEVLRLDLAANMGQMGLRRLTDLAPPRG